MINLGAKYGLCRMEWVKMMSVPTKVRPRSKQIGLFSFRLFVSLQLATRLTSCTLPLPPSFSLIRVGPGFLGSYAP